MIKLIDCPYIMFYFVVDNLLIGCYVCNTPCMPMLTLVCSFEKPQDLCLSLGRPRCLYRCPTLQSTILWMLELFLGFSKNIENKNQCSFSVNLPFWRKDHSHTGFGSLKCKDYGAMCFGFTMKEIDCFVGGSMLKERALE